MKKVFVCLFGTAMLLSQAFVLGQVTPPKLSPNFLRRAFPQRLLFNCPDAFTSPVPDKVLSVGVFRLTVHPPNTRGSSPAQITVLPQGGTDFRIPLSFAGCKVWTADIDKNGKPDLIIATWEAANGPSTAVTLVLTDGENRPVVWHSGIADYDFNEHGLENLVDLDGDGRAEILVPEIDGLDRVHAQRGDRSIEAIIRYAISTEGLKRVDGPFAGSAFPILDPPNAKDLRVDDLSTSIDRVSSGITVKSVAPKCPTRGIQIDDPKNYECKIALSDNTVLLGRPEMVVIDGATGRRIEMESIARIDQMIEEARSNGYPIQYTCKSKDTMCQPHLVWATEKKNSK